MQAAEMVVETQVSMIREDARYWKSASIACLRWMYRNATMETMLSSREDVNGDATAVSDGAGMMTRPI